MYKLSKLNLLRKNKHFQAVFNVGRSYANKSLVVYATANDDGPRRVGFVTGKRIGNAVVRNRVKRCLREAFRLNQHRIKDGVDLVFVVRKPLVGLSGGEVEARFLDLCSRAKLLNR